jgi:2-keto-4-pentenoate hydratase/2-oxohepta-3-ene-1,7-dioic acid hydratase in catechol pathway
MTWFPSENARIFCAAVNYADHRMEVGATPADAHPMLFLRTVQSLVRGGEPVVKPSISDRFDFEGELAAVIGTGGRNIGRAEALSQVSHYTAFMDGSVRDWQRHTSQYTPGKNFDRSGSIGPDLVPAATFGDYRQHRLVTRLNGQTVQETEIALMLFDIEALIAYISAFTALRPGDVIATGTCAGVGDKRVPPLYMQPGDTVEVDISGLPLLSNPVVGEG